MARLFDAYIIVDWSAASKPALGANSIWVGALARDALERAGGGARAGGELHFGDGLLVRRLEALVDEAAAGQSNGGLLRGHGCFWGCG